jgi:hypothetical protein
MDPSKDGRESKESRKRKSSSRHCKGLDGN